MTSKIDMKFYRISSIIAVFLASTSLFAGPITSGGEDPTEFAKEVFSVDESVRLAKEGLSRVGWSWTYTNSEGEEVEYPVDALQVSANCRLGSIPKDEFPCSHRVLVVQFGRVEVNGIRKFETVKAVVTIAFDGTPILELSDITPY